MQTSGIADGLIFAGAQAQGTRELQEDSYGHFEGECFIMADGMGGQPHGEIASSTALERALFSYEILRKKHFYWRAKEHLVAQLFKNVSRGVFIKQKSYPDMGTTLVVSCFSSGWWWIGNVGDSRAYRLRDGQFEQITTDHNHGHTILTRWIPMEKYTKPDQFGGELLAGDIFLLCSDGLTKAFSDDVIQKELMSVSDSVESLQSCITKLVEEAAATPGSDNTTAWLIKKL